MIQCKKKWMLNLQTNEAMYYNLKCDERTCARARERSRLGKGLTRLASDSGGMSTDASVFELRRDKSEALVVDDATRFAGQ